MNRDGFKSTIEIILITLTTAFIMIGSSMIIYTNIEQPKSYENSSIENSNNEKFDIHYKDIDNNQLILCSIEINKNKSIMEKLEVIANEVSNKLFKDRKIEVLKIEDNIAYINLKDEGKDDTWYNIFQGSSGGGCTAYGLLSNFLQEDYTGDWIDGVYITYNGEASEMDHLGEVFFGKIIYRDPKAPLETYEDVSFDYVEDYIDINDYTIEENYKIDINLDSIDDEILLIHKGKYESIYYDPMIYIIDGSSNELLTFIPINPFNPTIDKIKDLTGDGVPDININFSSNGNVNDDNILYEYKDGMYIAQDTSIDEFDIQVSASSYFWIEFYENKNISYKPEMVLDARPRTSWIEGVDGSGVDEWIQLDFGKNINVDNIYILNGLGDVTGEYYYKNHRVKKMLLEFSNGEEQIIELEDNFIREQEIKVDDKITSYIKFTILDVYGGSKYDDTCIGSISINNPRIHNYSLDNNSNKNLNNI